MENTELQKQWQKRITDYRNSGLTAVAWSEKNDCSVVRLKYWIMKFNRAAKKSDETKWAKVEIVHANPIQISIIGIPLLYFTDPYVSIKPANNCNLVSLSLTI